MQSRKPKCYISGLLLALFIGAFISYMAFQTKGFSERPAELSQTGEVAVEDFLDDTQGADRDDAKAIQRAIDFCAAHKKEKVTLQANKTYRVQSGFTVKEGVKLEFGQQAVLAVRGNAQVMKVEKDAAVINGTIQITDPSFQSEVIALEGTDRFDAANKTRLENMTIINKSGSHKGIGLSLYAKGPWHNISFVNFTNITVIGFETGIQLKAEDPGGGTYSWVNANRFDNVALEDCVLGIRLIGSISIPNECSGNFFTGLQIQLTENTKRLLEADGSYNRFEGMAWDQQRVQHQQPLIVFTSQTEKNKAEINIDSQYIHDKGTRNEY
ncbi:hypothetical protein [Bacillus badius]|uniref:hypothetical protein n=1 Tax=Bacillus badius TaxID=1455 RepID=UPI000697B41D|nr:hypothetical protein [Bacillus badius]